MPFIIENTGILSETAILIMQKTTILIMQQNKRENISLLGKYKIIKNKNSWPVNKVFTCPEGRQDI